MHLLCTPDATEHLKKKKFPLLPLFLTVLLSESNRLLSVCSLVSASTSARSEVRRKIIKRKRRKNETEKKEEEEERGKINKSIVLVP